jgi:sugar-specific transcriptional regulator TrmB
LEDGKLYQAYIADAFDAEEFTAKRQTLKERKQKLEEEKEKLQKKLTHQASQTEQKAQILVSVAELKRRAGEEISFDLKRRILRAVVDKIVVNTREEWFELEGAISGTFDFDLADRHC